VNTERDWKLLRCLQSFGKSVFTPRPPVPNQAFVPFAQAHSPLPTCALLVMRHNLGLAKKEI
jgi:hypothetical protein